MATTACPGCGLPRAEAEADKPCPVCEAVSRDLSDLPRRDVADSASDGLPADGSQLATARSERSHGHRPEVFAGTVGIVLGVLLTVLVQSLIPAPKPDAATSTASQSLTPPATDTPPTPLQPVPESQPLETGPMPVVADNVAPSPREITQESLPVGDAPHIVLEVNRPDGTMSFPGYGGLVKPGMKIILRGRLHTLNMSPIEGPIHIDASGLTVQKVNVNGKINAGSVVKIHAPGGSVLVHATISERSELTIDAPEGEVLFRPPSSTTRHVPRIESGGRVNVTARKVEFFAPVIGDGSRITLLLNNLGMLKIPSVQGAVVIEYRKSRVEDEAPRVEIPDLDPHATLRRVN